MKQSPRPTIARSLIGTLCIGCIGSIAGLATGCSPAGGNSGSDDATGGLTVSITDAPADELASFTVDITAMHLTRVDGSTVGVLPGPVTVDLVTLVEASEVLNMTNVPAGKYTSVTATFDFTNASAMLIDETTPATILGSNGLALTGSIALPVEIGNALSIVAGKHRILELDFDLNHSVTVDASANEVTVEPAIVMRVDRTDPKELRLGGELIAVDLDAGSFAIELQSRNGTKMLEVTVSVDESTVFQIDGVPGVGASGLAALSAKPAGTWVQGYGAIHPEEALFEAKFVEAGVGTLGGGTDILHGHVIGRVDTGDLATLMVLGHSNSRDRRTRFHNQEFTVNVDAAATKVVIRGSASVETTDLLNIGQSVHVFGSLSGFVMDASTPTSVVRVRQSRVRGFANGEIVAGILDLDLERVDRRDEGRFLWSEGGLTPLDPDAAQVATSGLGDGLGIEAQTPVEVRGFFSGVGDSGPDFNATSVANLADVPSTIRIADREGGLTVVTTVQPNEIRFEISGTPLFRECARLEQVLVGSSELPTDPEPTILPAGDAGVYALRDLDARSTSVFLTFEEYALALDDVLARGAMLSHFGAVGQYDAETNSLRAGLIMSAVD